MCPAKSIPSLLDMGSPDYLLRSTRHSTCFSSKAIVDLADTGETSPAYKVRRVFESPARGNAEISFHR